MKITAKTTKRELKDILNTNFNAVKEADSNLYERVAYTAKVAKEDDSKVTKRDLVDLVKEVERVLGDKFVEPTKKEETPKAENSTKRKLHSKKEKVETPVEEEKAPVEETPAESEEEEEKKVDTKKSAKKSSKLNKKKEEPKKDDATASQNETVQTIFPQTLTVGKDKDTKEYRLAPEIKSMDDLYNATIDKDMDEVLFAYHWTRKQLKLDPYFDGAVGKITQFENDLDLAGTLYVSEERKIAYHISLYTEGCYNTLEEDFEEFDGIRYAGNVEFQIYRRV